PPSASGAWWRGGKAGAKRSGAGTAAGPSEPEKPLDWSMIESALGPTAERAKEAPRLADRQEPKSPSIKRLSSPRKSLEEEGVESGREAHRQDRNQLIQMNRVMADLKAMTPKGEEPAPETTWLERVSEKIGDSLAEPSAAQILIAILVVLLVLAAALAVAIG